MTTDASAVLTCPLGLGALGACVGSFLNVVIHRVPRKMSVVSPRSRCNACGKAIAPWDNVPILAWIWLRGRCRGCGEDISVRYPVVEGITAALWMVSGMFVTDPLALAFTLLFLSAMIVVTFIDLDHMIIPDLITLPGMVVGILAAFLGSLVTPTQALIGLLAGGGGLFALASAYRAATGREGLGGGDIKLLGMVGAFLGPSGALLTILVGSVAGTLYACTIMLRQGVTRHAELPFGTFLAPGAVAVMFLGSRMLDAYWGLF